MNLKCSFEVVLLLVIVECSSVLGIKCYSCNSGKDEMCATLPDSKFLKDCTHPYNETCRVQEQWVDFAVLGQASNSRIIRQCAATRYDDAKPCYYRTGFGGRTNVCYCNGDGCNPAPAMTASVLLTTIGIFLVMRIL